jgi:TPR repeat protein
LYKTGKGVQQNLAEAAKWFRRAAEQGHPIAENTIGYMYCRGEGVGRDYRQAVEWLQKAAEQNYAPAQMNLGFLYQSGLGVPLNYAEAYKWFTLAANGAADDNARSRSALKALAQIMTTRQLRDGQGRTSDWLSRHNNVELAVQKTDAAEVDSYATAAEP